MYFLTVLRISCLILSFQYQPSQPTHHLTQGMVCRVRSICYFSLLFVFCGSLQIPHLHTMSCFSNEQSSVTSPVAYTRNSYKKNRCALIFELQCFHEHTWEHHSAVTLQPAHILQWTCIAITDPRNTPLTRWWPEPLRACPQHLKGKIYFTEQCRFLTLINRSVKCLVNWTIYFRRFVL